MMEGIYYDTSPKDYRLTEHVQLLRYDGTYFEQFGPVWGADGPVTPRR